MKLCLRVCFEVAGFREFNIENAPFVPSVDSSFYCKWEDFIEDKRQVDKLNEFDKRNVWNVVNILSADFSKEKAVCWVVLDANHPLTDEERSNFAHS